MTERDPDPNADIPMPSPYGFAPAPGAHWDPESSVDFAAENTAMLRDLWASKRPSPRMLPSFILFDGLELRPWLDNLIVLDVDRDAQGARTYQYRAVGAGASVIEGGDFSGRALHDALSPIQVASRIQLYDRAIRTRSPTEIHRRVEMVGAGIAKWDLVALPLARDGLKADHLMVLVYIDEVG